jgi:Icc-related predicted phosphoesterase
MRHDHRAQTPLRVAAVGDIHMGVDTAGRFRRSFQQVAACADVLLLAGDLTRSGTVPEARCAAAELSGLGIPIISVLGNHDYHSEQVGEITGVLVGAGVQVLEGSATVLNCRGMRLGVAGCKGFGGGFSGAMVHEFGEPQIKEFTRHGRDSADQLAGALAGLDCDVRVALTHYAPSVGTLEGEPSQLYPLLGSDLLGRAIDSGGVALAIHGHAHHGAEYGLTAGGVPVRNVAYPVIRTAYRIYTVYPSTGSRDVG